MGVEIFCNWHDVAEASDRTLRVLREAGATRAIPMVQAAIAGPTSMRNNAPAVRRFVAQAKAHGFEVTLCTGPAVLVAQDPLRCRDNLAALCRELGCPPMLDAEPVRVAEVLRHWTPELLAPWLELADLEVTTTRAEVTHLGRHGRVDYAQLEGQDSTATLPQAMALHMRSTDRERIVPVIGDFDAKGDPRTLAEVRTDLDRCTPQAKLAGRLAVWVAQTTSLPDPLHPGQSECELLAAWGAETFG